MSSAGLALERQPLGAPGRGRIARHFGWLSLGGLLLALSTLFVFSGDRERFYRSQIHDWASARALAEVENLSWRRTVFYQVERRPNGALWYDLHQRFPIGGYVLIKLAILPFEDDLRAQILAARVLMLAAFCAAAVFAYLALLRISENRSVAFGATLLAFSSYYMLRYSDMISNEGSPDLCAVMLVFHGMVLFEQERRFAQLVAKVCVALLLGWHVYALLAPFIALGLGAELWRAWTSGQRSRKSRSDRPRALAAAVLRSRYLRVGLIALAGGIGMLAHNLQVEQAALAGERPLADLPSFRSLLRRTGSISANTIMADATAWPNFLAGQLHRLGGMIVPYAAPLPLDDLGELPWAASEGPMLAWLGGLAVGATLGGLALVRRRRLWATLALSSVCWAVPLRFSTADPTHDFESMFLVGLPLALFALLLLGVVRNGGRQGRRVAAGLAALAATVFALSSRAMSEAGRDAESAARDRVLMSEFEAIRAVTRGNDVLVAVKQDAAYRFMKPRRLRVRRAYSSTLIDDSGRMIFAYFMAGAVMRYADPLGDAARREERTAPDFVLAFERLPLPSLRTPRHRFVFLYDSADAIQSVVQARRRDYRAIAATEPAAIGVWNVHAGQWTSGAPELAYLREDCVAEDTAGRFFLHVLPKDDRAAPGSRTLPDGYVQERVVFADNGLRFDGKCMMRWPAPSYGVAAARTGQYGANRGPLLWRAAFYLDTQGLRRAYRQARAGAPAARERFNVYLTARRLVYVRESCAQADVESRMFLHFLPADAAALPPARRDIGFDNADFQFAERGAAIDGRCVATVPLPEYRVARVRTGELRRTGGEVWRAEFDIQL